MNTNKMRQFHSNFLDNKGDRHDLPCVAATKVMEAVLNGGLLSIINAATDYCQVASYTNKIDKDMIQSVMDETKVRTVQYNYVRTSLLFGKPNAVIKAATTLLFAEYNKTVPEIVINSDDLVTFKNEFGNDVYGVAIYDVDETTELYLLCHRRGWTEGFVRTSEYLYVFPIQKCRYIPQAVYSVDRFINSIFKEEDEDDFEENEVTDDIVDDDLEEDEVDEPIDDDVEEEDLEEDAVSTPINNDSEEENEINETDEKHVLCNAIYGEYGKYIATAAIDLMEHLATGEDIQKIADILAAMLPFESINLSSTQIIDAANTKEVQYTYTKHAMEIFSGNPQAGKSWWYPGDVVESMRKFIFTNEGELMPKDWDGVYVDRGTQFMFPGSLCVWKVGCLRVGIYTNKDWSKLEHPEARADVLIGNSDRIQYPIVLRLTKETYRKRVGLEKVLEQRIETARKKIAPDDEC